MILKKCLKYILPGEKKISERSTKMQNEIARKESGKPWATLKYIDCIT